MHVRVLRRLPGLARLLRLAALAAGAIVTAAAHAQPPAGGGPVNARQGALLDLTGQWVAVVNEDWRWRMLTPPVGDVSSLPVNNRGRQAAAAWDLARDRAEGSLCKAFAGPGLMRQPTRIRISWEDNDTLLLDFDAGRQQRRLEFGRAPANPPAPSLQGYSEASWYSQRLSRGVFGASTTDKGALHVVTTQFTPGYLRPNGVPYSDETVMKEYFHSFTLPGDAGTWLIVTTVVEDPVYLTQELIISTQFRKEDGTSGWNPRPCDISAPLVEREPEPPGPFG